MINLGADGKWASATNGDRFGHVVRTKNLSFEREGYLGLARKAMVLYSETQDADFMNPIAIAADTTNAYAVTTGNAFQIDLSSNTFPVTDISTGSPPALGPHSDVVFFQAVPHFSGSTNVKSYASGSWTSRITGLSSSYPHPLCVSEHQNALAAGNGNTVKLYDTSYSLLATLTLPSDYVVTWIRWNQYFLVIGTRNINGGSAKLFFWNGSGASAQYGYGVQADWIYSGCAYQSAIAVITSAGQLLRASTAGFDPTPLATLPVYYTPYAWLSSAGTSSLLGNVASRGMQAAGDTIHFVMNADLSNGPGEGPGRYLPDMPGGLWTFDPNVGLSHRAGFSYADKLAMVPTELLSNYLKFSTAHQALTGDPILCSFQSGLSGLNAGQTYYAIVDSGASTTTCRLALSPADAYNGRYISFSGAPTSDKFVFDAYENVGAGRIASPGAVFVFGKLVPNLFYASKVLYGGNAYDATLASKGVLLSLGMGRNRGYFVTAKITSATATDFFNKLIAFVDALNLDSDQILLKYRTSKRFGLPTPLSVSDPGATWTSATTFTVDSTIKDVKSIAVGDEIEITHGAGAGYNLHVTAIDTSSPTYTFTVDETMPVSSGNFDFVADNWTKGGTFGRSSLAELRTGFQTALAGAQGKWLQLKIEMRGRDLLIQEMQIANSLKQ